MSEHKRDEEAEAAVLGSMLMNPRAVSMCVEQMRPEWFYNEAHRDLFATMQRLFAEGKKVDAVTVVGDYKLRGGQALDRVGGPVGVLSLAERVPAVANCQAYVDLVREMFVVRSWQMTADRLVVLTGAHTDRVDNVCDLADQALDTVMETIGVTSGENERDGISSVESGRRLRERYGQPVEGTRIPFMLDKFNRRGGMAPGEICVVSGHTGDGKTWWAQEEVEIACLAGMRTAVFSLEVSEPLWKARQLAMISGFELEDIEAQRVPLEKLEPYIKAMDKWPLDVFDKPAGVTQIKEAAQRARLSGDPYRLIVIDHLLLMSMTGRGDFRVKLNDALTGVREIANSDSKPVIVLVTQLSRPDKIREKFPVPSIGDLRESGAIEQIADYVVMVWRERDANERQTNTGLAKMAKQRTGRNPGTTAVRFDEEYMRFVQGSGEKARPPKLVQDTPVQAGLSDRYEEALRAVT